MLGTYAAQEMIGGTSGRALTNNGTTLNLSVLKQSRSWKVYKSIQSTQRVNIRLCVISLYYYSPSPSSPGAPTKWSRLVKRLNFTPIRQKNSCRSRGIRMRLLPGRRFATASNPRTQYPGRTQDFRSVLSGWKVPGGDGRLRTVFKEPSESPGGRDCFYRLGMSYFMQILPAEKDQTATKTLSSLSVTCLNATPNRQRRRDQTAYSNSTWPIGRARTQSRPILPPHQWTGGSSKAIRLPSQDLSWLRHPGRDVLRCWRSLPRTRRPRNSHQTVWSYEREIPDQ